MINRRKLNRKDLQAALDAGRIEWQKHALERMFERGIKREAVKHIIAEGDIIEEYPDDAPFPSALIFGYWHNGPLHVVIACDYSTEWIYVITAYKPDLEHFESDFKTRRKK